MYSYVTTMRRPSSLPLSVRTVEWIRANHGAWAVKTVERYWYTWHAPKKGGPALKTLPTVGVPVPVSVEHRATKHHRLVSFRPVRLRPLIRPALPDEGAWHRFAAVSAGGPAVLVTTFRSEPAYPRIVAYVAWIDHTKTQLALYPGRYEPPNASPAGRSRFRRASGGACWRRSTAVSPTRTGTAASPSTARPRAAVDTPGSKLRASAVGGAPPA